MSLDTEILLTAFVLLHLRRLLFGEIKRYKSPIRIIYIEMEFNMRMEADDFAKWCCIE